MTLAILFTPSRTAAPLTLAGGESLPDRLREQLLRSGARDVRVAATLAEVATLARTVYEPVLLCGDDLVAHAAVLRHLATNPAPASVALVLADPAGPGQAVITEERGQLTSAVVPGAEPESTGEPGRLDWMGGDGTFGGALRVRVADLPALAAAAASAAAAVAAHPGDEPSALDRLLVELVRAGTTVGTQRVRLLVADRVTDRSAALTAEAAVRAVDSDRAELRLAVKEKDDFFTTYFVSTWSPWVTKLCARIGLGPTGVTAVSVLFAAVAAVLFGVGGRPALITGGILLYLGFVLDCVDGQLARYTRNFSVWGGWLDTMADRAKEYLVYAGLAVGVNQEGLGNGWTLAIAAMVLQTARHMTDTWYGALHDEAARRPKSTAAGAAAGGLGARLSQASTRVQADTGSLTYWLKRTVVFPIGERWALIALTVALFNPLVSLIAVLVWGGLAAAYTLALRSMRARSMRVSVLDGVDTPLYRDDGPLVAWLGRRGRSLPPLPLAILGVLVGAGALGVALAAPGTGAQWAVAGSALVILLAGLPSAARHTGPLDWLVPAALRAAEYLFVIAIDVAADVPGWVTFGLLFALALHHYDLTARLEKREGAPPLKSFFLGWDGRLIFLAVAVLAGLATVGMSALTAYIFVILTVSAVAGWTVAARRTRGTAPTDVNTNALAVAGAAEERNR